MIKKKIYNILNKNQGKYSNLINGSIIFLILLSVPLDGLESYVKITKSAKNIIIIIDILISLVFSTEYILRLYSCTVNPKFKHPFFGRIKYALTPLMLIDLFALPPYISLGYGYLRTLRACRILMLIRYTEGLQVFEEVLKHKAKELTIIFGFFVILWVWSAILIFRFEHQIQPQVFGTLFDALWWSVSTFTTIGYGDMIPATVGGKIVAIITMLSGPILFSLAAAVLTSGLLHRLRRACKKQLP